jgi:uncharacterized protein
MLQGALNSLESDCFVPPAPDLPVLPRVDRLYQQVGEIHTDVLTDEWTLFCNTLAGGAPTVLNRSATSRLCAFLTPRRLRDSLDFQFATSHLIAPIGTQYQAPQGRPTTLTAWMHITNACNLDCPYCYIRKSGARMSLETGMRAVDAIMNTAIRHGFSGIKLKYAGGEAALHYRMIQRLHTYAVERARQSQIALDAVILSNGTIMPVAFAEWIATTSVKLMLSVDGIGAEHDAQRPWKHGGGGAFAALEHNLIERLLSRGIRPDLCITLTSRNAHAASAVVRWALHHELLFTLNFYREHEQSAKYNTLRYEEEQIIAGMLAAYAAIEQHLPSYPFLDGLLDHVQAQAHDHTCGIGQSYVVITHEGRIAQCQMMLQNAQFFDQDSDLIQIVAAGPLHNVSADDKDGCRSCQWRYRCAGGCPIATLRATGRIDVKSPNCNIYQKLLPAALRLEGLRLLKVNGQLSA